MRYFVHVDLMALSHATMVFVDMIAFERKQLYRMTLFFVQLILFVSVKFTDTKINKTVFCLKSINITATIIVRTSNI